LAGLCPACLLREGAADDSVTAGSTRSFEPPSSAELASLFPQLEILEFIGKGGMGAVYKARQKELDRIVALKILPPAMSEAPGFAERFTREAKALAKLNHPGIVTIHEFGRADGLFYFLMEFVDGVNLRQLLAAGRVSPREALAIVPEICDALQFAHDHGIVHRDIKPANVLIDRRGRVKVADFGLAKLIEEGTEAASGEQRVSGGPEVTEAGKVMGTPSYMAPEQRLRPEEVDHRADIYALGVVFYELLTGELPAASLQPPSSRGRGVKIDVRLDEIVLRALEKEPALRYQQASQVKSAVETVTHDATPPPRDAAADRLTEEILARDYAPQIGACLRRGWELVKSDFWPLVGITALVLVLLGVAGSVGGVVLNSSDERRSSGAGILYLLVKGPLVAGLQLYFLQKIRGGRPSVETVFSGFSQRFLHLFLAGFVTTMLTTLGYFCFVLPGIYLTIAWTFTLALVIDKQLHFWSAMELSRKAITRHWLMFFAFALVLVLCKLAGLVAFGIGFFITLPIAVAALMYAYEDTFAPGAAPAIVTKTNTSKYVAWSAAALAAIVLLLIGFPPSCRDEPASKKPTGKAAPVAGLSWMEGEWAFDAEATREWARKAAASASDEQQKAVFQALSTAGYEGSEGMTWTITATEMQSNHPQTGSRKGPYRIVKKRDADTAEIEVMDEGTPKRMIAHREGELLRLSNAKPEAGALDVPGFYKKVAPTSPNP
jgi:predicted Ser/Thr protein kinase